MNVTGLCQKCEAPFEFDPGHTGLTAKCPHCGEPTLLKLPENRLRPVAKPIADAKEKRKYRPSSLIPIVLWILGTVLIVDGCTVQMGKEITSLHQVFGALHYLAGWVLIGFGFVVSALNKIANNQ